MNKNFTAREAAILATFTADQLAEALAANEIMDTVPEGGPALHLLEEDAQGNQLWG